MTEMPEFKMPSPFRVWLQNKWFEHKEELLIWEKRQPDYTDAEFFQKNKWSLKKIYKEQ